LWTLFGVLQGKANVFKGALKKMMAIAKFLVILSFKLKLLRILGGKEYLGPIANV